MPHPLSQPPAHLLTVLDHPDDRRKDRAASATCNQVFDNRADVETRTRCSCGIWGHGHAGQAVNDLSNYYAANSSGDGIARPAEALVLQGSSSSIAANRASNKLNDDSDDIQGNYQPKEQKSKIGVLLDSHRDFTLFSIKTIVRIYQYWAIVNLQGNRVKGTSQACSQQH